ncbi:hypothetical protein [Rossellomorea marisflavi]|uniref:hypothetical protein n=1 Tax=Rossellomorea marisflavi TaxID=189381 RepID=UPI00345DF505
MKKMTFEITIHGGECSIIELPLSEPMKIFKILKEGRLNTEFSTLHFDGRYIDVNPGRDHFTFDNPMFCKNEISFKVWNREPFMEKIIITILGD